MDTARRTGADALVSDLQEAKACCADAYGRDAVAMLLGDSYHPGGLRLTRRLADALGLQPDLRVADVASGPGTTARLLAAEYGVAVEGVDLGGRAVARAADAAERRGLAGKVRFRQGDAENLPLASGMFDAAVCECALCTFPDKRAAADEFARILRPGGRLGITDVTIADSPLPPELGTLAAWVACIAGARPVADYRRILDGAGLIITMVEGHDSGVTRMLDEVEARLRLLRITAADRLAGVGIDADAVELYLSATRRALAAGLIGYTLLVAEKPGMRR